MNNPFISNYNQFKPSSKEKPKPINIYEKPLEQTSFGMNTHIKNTSNIFSPLGQNISENNSNKDEYDNPFLTKNNQSSGNRTIIIKEQSNPENTKIVETTKTYFIDGENLNEEDIKEKFGHKLFQGNELIDMNKDKNEFIEGEDATELIEKRIPGSKSTTTTTKTTATTTTTTTITKIITDGGKTVTQTEKVTKVHKSGNNNDDNDNDNNINLFSKKIETIPSSSTKITINSDNINNIDNSRKRLFQNIIKCNNYEDNSDDQNMNDSNEVKNTFDCQVIADENGMENNYENIYNNEKNDNDINKNININNHIKFAATNNNNNKQTTVSFGGINFGAPKNVNYTPLSSSKVEFGIKKNNSNQNQNNNSNNNNDSNISDSADKSSEQGFPPFSVKNEAENSNQPVSSTQNAIFGFVENKNDINTTPQKTNNFKLEDHNIKFGFISENENKKIIAEDNKDENMNIEPGEIIDNENGEIKEDNIEIIIKEKNEEVIQNKKDDKKDDTKKEDKKKEEKKDKNDKKDKKKEIEKIKPESYFQKSLFNNDENMQVEGSSLFSQKLFQNNTNDNNNNQQNNSNSLFNGLFKNKSFSLNFNSPNNDQKIEENFFAKNKISSSLINSNKESLFGDEGKKSGTFIMFSQESKNTINNESNKENDKKPTLGEIIREGGVFNADSQKKTEKDQNQIKESTKDNTNTLFSSISFGADSNNKTNVSPFTDYINDNKGKNFITGDNKEDNKINFSSLSFGAVSNNKVNTSPFTNYINDNKGKNFITGDNKDNKINIVNNSQNSLFSFNNSNNLFNIKTSNNNDNPFLKVLNETNSSNNKSSANNLDKKPEQKIENKSLFSSIMTTKSYELENGKEKPDENKMSQISSSDKNSKDSQTFSIFNSQQNVENKPKTLEVKNPESKPEEKKSIFSSCSSNFFNVKKDQKSFVNENKSSSSLFPGLSFEKNKSEINLTSKPSSLFPGLNPQIDQNINKTSSSLFPGLNNNNTLNIFGSEDTKSKPLFPGGSNTTKTLNIFGDNKESSNDKKEEKKDENKFTLFGSQTNIDNKKNEKSGIESISLGGSNPKITATSIIISKTESNQIKNEDEEDNNDNNNENDNENENENNAIKSDLPLLNNVIKFESDININGENKEEDNIYKNENIEVDNNNENDEEEEEDDEQGMEIENIEINNNPNMAESPTKVTQEDKNKKNILLSDIIISKKEQEDKQKANSGSLFGKDFINQGKNNGGNSLFNTNLVENVKNEETTTQKKPEIKSLFGGLFNNENNKGFDSLFLNNNSSSNLFDDNNKNTSIFSGYNFGNNSTGLFGNDGGLFGDHSNANTGFFEGLKNNDEDNKKENEKEKENENENEKKDNLTEVKEIIESKESIEIKDSKDKIEIKNNKENGDLLGSDNFGGLFGTEKNKNENNENENKEKDKDKDKDKDKNETGNLFGNNDGKSIFGGVSGINTNNNLKIFDTETTPIKASTLFKNEIENEKKEKEEKEKKEKEKLEKERLEKERGEKERLERLEKERLEKLERERLERLERERLEQLEREKEEKEKLNRDQQETQEIEISLQKSINEEENEKSEEDDKKNKNNENINMGESEKMEEEEKEDNNNENENVEEMEIEKLEEEEKEDNNNENEVIEETEKEVHKNEEEENEDEGEDIKMNRGQFNGETLIKENSESESEKNENNEKNDLKISKNEENEIISENLKEKEDHEEIEQEEESQEKENESDIELSIEEEYNSSQNIQNNASAPDASYNNSNNNMNIISNAVTVRKPVSRQMYADLIQKLYEITDELQNRINSEEKYTVTIYKNTLDKYLKDLEDLIIEMKQKYILTLIKKHFEKDPNKKKQIIIEANIPKIRNSIKRTFKELIMLIRNNLELSNRKYYYLQILNVLNKYEVIGEDEIKKMIKLNKKKRLNKLNNGINGIVDGKELKKGNKNGLKKYNDKEKDSWIMAKKSSGISFKIFTFVIPLFYIANYVYANFKA